MHRYLLLFWAPALIVLLLATFGECNYGWEYWLGRRAPAKVIADPPGSGKSKREFHEPTTTRAGTTKIRTTIATTTTRKTKSTTPVLVNLPKQPVDHVNHGVVGPRPCPCSDRNLCKMVQITADREVYGFGVSVDPKVYSKYDWNKLTTLAMWNFTDDLMCLAHKHEVKLHLVGDYPYEELTNLTYRQIWIRDMVDRVKHEFLDGINFDPEYPIAQNSPERQALVDLVNETKIVLNAELPGAMVVFDAAWATYCVDERCYDYKGLAEVSDFLFIMAYCVQGQIWGPCVAMSNTPFFRMMQGVRGFLTLGIPSDKLVLGLPWFGYDYPCLSLSGDNICEIPAAEYHGAPCSDSVGEQRGYDEITFLLENTTIEDTRWSPDGQSPQFNFKNTTGQQRQLHYDDPTSLLLKYLWAVSNDLRGVGFWHIGYLNDMDQSPARMALRKRMWDLVPSSDTWENYAENALLPADATPVSNTPREASTRR